MWLDFKVGFTKGMTSCNIKGSDDIFLWINKLINKKKKKNINH